MNATPKPEDRQARREDYYARATPSSSRHPGPGSSGIVKLAGAEQETIAYRPWDIFVIPSWQEFRLSAETESTSFSASDQIAHTKLGIWREQRGSDDVLSER